MNELYKLFAQVMVGGIIMTGFAANKKIQGSMYFGFTLIGLSGYALGDILWKAAALWRLIP